MSLTEVKFRVFSGLHHYSKVRNSSTCMFINFWDFFPPVQSYLAPYVYLFSQAAILSDGLKLLKFEVGK